MLTMPVRLLACALLALLPGCLEVESMEITVVVDRANDRLDVMVMSRGLYSSATTDDNLRKDLADLLKCRDVSALPIPGLGVADFTDQDEDEKWQRTIEFLAIEPGAFFVDEHGRLCFYQFVRIDRVSELERVANELAREQWREDRAKSTPATRACLDDALRDGLAPGHIDGAGFVIRRPMSLDEHEQERRELWRDVAREVEKAHAGEDGRKPTDATERGIVQVLRDNDFATVRRDGYTECYIGAQGTDRCEYQVRGRPWRDNLLMALVATEPRPPEVGQARIDREFAAFRQREARVPEAFRAARERAAAARAERQGERK